MANGGISKFLKVIEKEGFRLGQEGEEKLSRYHLLLFEWGRKLPLVSKKELGEGLFKHYYDALGLSRFVPPGYFVDLGTGAGLPGIPLVIFRPDLEGLLVEINLKKSTFLRLAVQSLGLTKLTVERASWKDLELSADTAISKATGKRDEIRFHLSHLVKPGGLWIRFKARDERLLEGESVESFYNPFRGQDVELILHPGAF